MNTYNRSFSFGTIRPDPNVKADPHAFRKWIVALCAIRFDLERGQVVEECYPAGALSPEEEMDVAFSSFPDSMSTHHNRSSVHDSVFFFRIRRRGTPPVPPGVSRRSSTKSETPSASRSMRGRNNSDREGGSARGSFAASPPSYITSPRASHLIQEATLTRQGSGSDAEATPSGSSGNGGGSFGRADAICTSPHSSSDSRPVRSSLDGGSMLSRYFQGDGLASSPGEAPPVHSSPSSLDIRSPNHRRSSQEIVAANGGGGGVATSGDSAGVGSPAPLPPPRLWPADAAPPPSRASGAGGAGVMQVRRRSGDEGSRRKSGDFSGELTTPISPGAARRSSKEGTNVGEGGGSARKSLLSSPVSGSSAGGNGSFLDRLGPPSSGGPGSGGPRYLYGFVFNRQRQDERLKRGGEQKSVVLLSERPYSSVFKPFIQIAGPLYFDIGPSAFEQMAAYTSQWPPPQHGVTMELPIGSNTLKAHLPPAHCLPPGCGNLPMDDFTSSMAPNHHKSIPQGIFPEADIFGMYRGVLLQLWVLWELLLVGEPLLVIAPTPSQCSEAVACLLNLVAPLPLSIDFRPYFTIHDPDFSPLNALRDGEPVPAMILGVTNLFFLKALRSLPTVVSVGAPPAAGPLGPASAANSLQVSNTPARASSALPANTSWSAARAPGGIQLQLGWTSPLRRFSPGALLRIARRAREGPLSLMAEHREAVWTSYVPATKPDTAVLNRLIDAGPSARAEESMSVVNNEMLRRHFVELTTNFLAPFGPYLRAAGPPPGLSPFGDPPPLLPFDAHEFIAGLSSRGPGKFLAKRLRANWLDLYRRFLTGPNFMPWFQRRRAVAEAEQQRSWRRARAIADVKAYIGGMSEVELIDSFSAVERHLLAELQAFEKAGLTGNEPLICTKLRGDLRILYNALPRDMQQMMMFTPQRATLLQGGREPWKLPGRPSLTKDMIPGGSSSSISRNGGPPLSPTHQRERADDRPRTDAAVIPSDLRMELETPA